MSIAFGSLKLNFWMSNAQCHYDHQFELFFLLSKIFVSYLNFEA